MIIRPPPNLEAAASAGSCDEVTDEQGMSNKPRATPHALIMQPSSTSQSVMAKEVMVSQEYEGQSQCESAYNDSLATESNKQLAGDTSVGSKQLQSAKQLPTDTNNSFSKKNSAAAGGGVGGTHYQLQGMQRSMARVNNMLLRPASVLSEEQRKPPPKPPSSQSSQKAASSKNPQARTAYQPPSGSTPSSATKAGAPLSGLPRVAQ